MTTMMIQLTLEEYSRMEKENTQLKAEVERLIIIMKIWKEGGIIPPEAEDVLTQEVEK